MKRQEAFLGTEKLLKGGLHCHTTRSDGCGAPEDVIRLHEENGYDFLALTDHDIYNYRNFKPDSKLTILPAMEFDNTFIYGKTGFRTYHTVVIGPEKKDGNPYEQDQRFASGSAPDQEHFQTYLDKFHNDKQLTFYCHPEWSGTPVRFFEKMEGHFAMEIWNSGCAFENEMDMDAAYWDDLLGQGKRIFGVAVDDGHAMEHHCRGWVRVNAGNTVNDIRAALTKGAFYSSCGPEIKDFYVDDGFAYIECSPCSRIRMHSDMHPTSIQAGDGLTSAKFPITPNWTGGYKYIRMTVIDAEGKKAWTNPIFLDDIQ